MAALLSINVFLVVWQWGQNDIMSQNIFALIHLSESTIMSDCVCLYLYKVIFITSNFLKP
jgi:hypothetical protein